MIMLDLRRGHVDLMQFAITSILEPTRVMAADRKPEAGGEFPRTKLSISIDAKSRRGARRARRVSNPRCHRRTRWAVAAEEIYMSVHGSKTDLAVTNAEF